MALHHLRQGIEVAVHALDALAVNGLGGGGKSGAGGITVHGDQGQRPDKHAHDALRLGQRTAV